MLFILTYTLYFKLLVIPEDMADSFKQRVYDMFKSNKSQLEFLTLVGILLNGFMQGYVCSKHIYTFFIENLDTNPYSNSQINDYSNDSYDEKGSLYEYHVKRIHHVLDQVGYTKKKILKL